MKQTEPARAQPRAGLLRQLNEAPLGLVFASLLFAALAAYSNIWRAPFVFDDVISIVYNPNIRSLWPGDFLARSTELDITPWGRPLVAASLALNYALHGVHVGGYHALNFFIHLANALLAFLLLRSVLCRQPWSSRLAGAAGGLAWAVSLLWVLHPIGTAVATYTVQRAESMMTLCYLLTLYATWQLVMKEGASIASRARWLTLAIAACCAGMLCKESMLTAPVAAFLLVATVGKQGYLPLLSRHRGLWIGLASSWLILGWILWQFPRSASVGVGVLGMGGWEYLLIQSKVLLHYLGLILVPLGLSLSYPRRIWPLDEVPSEAWPLVPGAQWNLVAVEFTSLLLLFLLAILLLIKRPPLGFLLLLPFLILAPTSSLVPIATSVAADHRVYLPSLVVLSLLATGLYLLGRESVDAKAARLQGLLYFALVLSLAFVLGTLTWHRNQDYRDGVRVWERTLAQHPLDAAAWNELGSVFWMRGELDRAARAFQSGAAASPTYHLPRVNLAVTWWNLGRREQAVELLEQIIRLEPDNTNALSNLALYLEQLNQRQRAETLYTRLLQLQPDHKAARTGLLRLSPIEVLPERPSR